MGEFGIQMGQAAAGTANTIGGALMGLALGGINDRRQVKQQGRLNEQAYEINNRMAEANYNREMRKWEETNYSAQMEQLEKAGLNPGLMYGMSGGGGATAQSSGGQGVSGGHAPAGGGEAMAGMGIMQHQQQLALLQAQKENIEADTANKKADTINKPLTGENIEASTASLTQGVQNQRAVQKLTELEQDLKDLQIKETSGSMEQRIANLATEGSILMGEARSAMARANIDEVTQENKMKIVRQELLNMITSNSAMKQAITESAARVKKTDQEILTMIKSRFQSGEYLMLAQQGQNIEGNKIKMDQLYRQIAEETGMGEDVIKMIGGAMMGAGVKMMPNAPRSEDTYGEYDGKYYETHKRSQ